MKTILIKLLLVVILITGILCLAPELRRMEDRKEQRTLKEHQAWMVKERAKTDAIIEEGNKILNRK